MGLTIYYRDSFTFLVINYIIVISFFALLYSYVLEIRWKKRYWTKVEVDDKWKQFQSGGRFVEFENVNIKCNR
jgi:hypothetical protein